MDESPLACWPLGFDLRHYDENLFSCMGLVWYFDHIVHLGIFMPCPKTGLWGSIFGEASCPCINAREKIYDFSRFCSKYRHYHEQYSTQLSKSIFLITVEKFPALGALQAADFCCVVTGLSLLVLSPLGYSI